MQRALALSLLLLTAALPSRAPAKTQWAPSGSFSALHTRAVFSSETEVASRPCARERLETAAGFRFFLSRDSVGATNYLTTPNGLGVFSYANLNPTRFTDPDGRCVDLVSGKVSWTMCQESGVAFAGSVVGSAKAVGAAAVAVSDPLLAGLPSRVIDTAGQIVHLAGNLSDGHFFDTPEQVRAQQEAQRVELARQLERDAHPIDYYSNELNRWADDKLEKADRGQTFALATDWGELGTNAYLLSSVVRRAPAPEVVNPAQLESRVRVSIGAGVATREYVTTRVMGAGDIVPDAFAEAGAAMRAEELTAIDTAQRQALIADSHLVEARMSLAETIQEMQATRARRAAWTRVDEARETGMGLNPEAFANANRALENEPLHLAAGNTTPPLGVAARFEATEASVAEKLSKYLLNPEHPVGGTKAAWFEKALGFNQSNAGGLASQIMFDAETAVQTGVTQYGTKFNQLIPITGANGRVINVNFAWIRNNDGRIRLVTGIPAKP